jgi:two-component system LytT family response regulator
MIPKIFKVVVIDDQQADRDLISHYLMPHLDMQLVAQAATAAEGVAKIITCSPHLVFLDIRLPDKDGFAMLDEIKKIGINEFRVVFYSSSCDNHLKAIKYEAFDFLQKPLAEKDLVETLDRFRKKFFNLSTTHAADPELKSPAIDTKKLVMTPKGRLYIDTKKLMYVHSEIKHCNLYLSDGQIIYTCYTLKALLNHLSLPTLVKKHKSYTINEPFITGYSTDNKICFLQSGNLNFQIPVSRRRRKKRP